MKKHESMPDLFAGQPMKVDLFSFTQGNQKRISFMSQTVGLLADVDIETEHLRWMGDLRFVLGFLRGRENAPSFWRRVKPDSSSVVTRKTCKMELSMKVVEQDKSQMVDALHARRKSAAKGVPTTLPASDITSSDDEQEDGTESWVKFDKPILWMVAGKGPYASR